MFKGNDFDCVLGRIETHCNSGAVTSARSMGGSAWASSHLVKTQRAAFFVKTSVRESDMFLAEAAGLQALHATGTLHAPRPHGAGALPAGGSFIVMSALELQGAPDQAELGRRLGLLHTAPPAAPEVQHGYPAARDQ